MEVRSDNKSQQFLPVSEQIDLVSDKMSIYYRDYMSVYSYLEQELLIVPSNKKQFQRLHFSQKSLDVSINPEQLSKESFVVSKNQSLKRQFYKEDEFTNQHAEKQNENLSQKYQLSAQELHLRQKEREELRIEQIKKGIYKGNNENKQFYFASTIEVSEDQEQTQKMTESASRNKINVAYLEQELLIVPTNKMQFQRLHFHQKSLDVSINPFEQSSNESFVVSNNKTLKRQFYEQRDIASYEYAEKKSGKVNKQHQLFLQQFPKQIDEEQRKSKQKQLQLKDQEESSFLRIRRRFQQIYRIDNQILQFYVPSNIQVSEDQEQTHVTTESASSYFRESRFLKVQPKDRESQQKLDWKKRKAQELKSQQKKRLIQFSMMSPKVYIY